MVERGSVHQGMAGKCPSSVEYVKRNNRPALSSTWSDSCNVSNGVPAPARGIADCGLTRRDRFLMLWDRFDIQSASKRSEDRGVATESLVAGVNLRRGHRPVPVCA